ncbi:MAG: PLP-dependent aminotransferase family protein [Anaerolineales bacterium]
MSGDRSIQMSRGVSHLERSVMRDLLKLAVDPDIVSLAGGLPADETLPVDAYGACLDAVLARDGAASLQYSPPYAPLQAWIAEHMRSRGVACSPDQIFITNGAQQGLSILSTMLLDPGDPAAVEAIAFTGIQQVTAGRGAEVRTVAIDPTTGADVQALEDVFRDEPPPKLAVLVPNFHNPLSATMPSSARQTAAELAARYQVPLIEDDPYSMLRFEGDPLPPIKAYDQDGWVFYLGSFSKMFAPGVRLGWIVAPENMIPKITVVRESMDLETSTLTQRAVHEFIRRGHLETHLADMNALHKARRDRLLAALESEFTSGESWTRPQGGLFVWLTLAEGLDAWKLFEAAVAKKVAYIPGAAFAVEGGHENCLRLSFGNVRTERIETGVARLAEAIREAALTH